GPRRRKTDESNIDVSGKRRYTFTAGGPSGVSRTKEKAEKKVPFWETIRVAWKPYNRLYGYVGPYKWRFIFGLALGFLFGATQGFLPLVLQKVTSTVFHGAAPNPGNLAHHPELLNAGGSV